ncbi:MAG TPA: FHA domain-containing protein [Ktedonobacterales bacterium]|jgi:pSer/pThr/pTyr-binding forkhead associated (FHA) protein|nr:FHA domain-containing protein [Ktedonobacterales bacterium]
MSVRCSQGHENPDGSAFCDECGEALSAAPVAAAAPAMGAPMAPPAPVADASATGAQPRLTVESDGAVFDLAGKTEFMIGREDPISNIYPEVDLTQHGGEEGGVSRLHAKMLVNNGQYLVEDQNSTNFTYINRQRLQAKTPTPIKDGDELRLGRVVMKFQAN